MIERTSETVQFGPFSFTLANGLWRGAVEVPLPPRALAVLGALVARAGHVVSKAELLDAGWKDAFVTEASLLEAIHVLRAALGDDRRAPTYIQTVHRRGYRFVSPVTCPATGDESRASSSPSPSSLSHPSSLSSPSSPSPPFFSGPEWQLIVRRCGWAAAATALTSVLIAAFGPRPIDARPSHFSIALPAPIPVPPSGSAVSASPDGRRFAFVAEVDGRSTLFLREASDSRPTRIEDAGSASDPFFSPDGRLIGFFADGALKVVEPGRRARTITAAMAGAGATWIDADTIVFGGGPGGGLATVALAGGPPEVLIQPQALTPDVRFGWPDALPGGAGLLFTVLTPSGSDVAILERGATRHRALVHDAAFGRYAPTGHLIVERRGQLAAAPFDLARRRLTGGFRPVVTDVASASAFEGPRYAFSRSGALVYVPGTAAGPLSVRWRADGNASSGTDRDLAQQVSVGPAAMGAGDEADSAGGRLGIEVISPVPSGLEVAFAANKTGPYNLFVRPSAGGQELPLDTSPWNQVPTSWSPDGRYLAFTEFHPATGADVWILDRLTGARRPLARTPLDETAARYSPDGRWLAYLARAAGDWQVVVVPAAGGAARTRVPASRVWADDSGAAGPRHELRIVLAWFTELSHRMRGPA